MSDPVKPRRARLAQEARRLAMECVEGTAPRLIPHILLDRDTGLYCVAGLLGARIGSSEFGVFDVCDDDALAVLIDANNGATDADRHGAVVFPLLALADALEAEPARSTSGRPPANDPSSEGR